MDEKPYKSPLAEPWPLSHETATSAVNLRFAGWVFMAVGILSIFLGAELPIMLGERLNGVSRSIVWLAPASGFVVGFVFIYVGQRFRLRANCHSSK